MCATFLKHAGAAIARDPIVVTKQKMFFSYDKRKYKIKKKNKYYQGIYLCILKKWEAFKSVHKDNKAYEISKS